MLKLLFLPVLVLENSFKSIAADELVLLGLTSKRTCRVIRSFGRRKTISIIAVNVSLNHDVIYTDIKLIDNEGKEARSFNLNHSDGILRVAAKIGNFPIAVCKSSYSNSWTMHTPDVLRTTVPLVDLLLFLYYKALFKITFVEVDSLDLENSTFLGLIVKAKKIKVDECQWKPKMMHVIGKHLSVYHDLTIKYGCVKITKPFIVNSLSIEEFENKQFLPHSYRLYQCKHLKTNLDEVEVVQFVNQWKQGHFKALVTFETKDIFEFAQVFESLGAARYNGAVSRIFKSERGEIDCTDGYDVTGLDGALGTLVYTEHNFVLNFVVWQ